MIAYLESSAAAKLLTNEKERNAVVRFLDGLSGDDDAIVSSTLLETELRRAATRDELPQTSVTAILNRVDVFDLPRSTFTEAGILPGRHLRSLDAIHITSAIRIEADVIVTYDKRQIEAAEAAGLRAHSPE